MPFYTGESKMDTEIEPDLATVFQFVEAKISADKLQIVADSIPGAARPL
jgi:hypothetical protein